MPARTKAQPPAASPATRKQIWVLDANVLYNAAATGYAAAPPEERAQHLLALKLLSMVNELHQIAEDRDGRINREYQRAWQRIKVSRREHPSFDAAHALWYALWDQPHHRCQAKIPQKLYQRLLAANMKPAEDIAYVETALATADKLIATEDSDFSPEIRARLAAEIGVQALPYRDALDKAKSR